MPQTPEDLEVERLEGEGGVAHAIVRSLQEHKEKEEADKRLDEKDEDSMEGRE